MGEETESFSISGEPISPCQRASDERVCLSAMRGDVRPGIFYGWIVAWAAFVLLTMLAGMPHSNAMMFPFLKPIERTSRFRIFLQPDHGLRHRTDREFSG